MTASFNYTLDIEPIPTLKLVDIIGKEGDERVLYQCPDTCWTEHFEAWVSAYRSGNRHAPSPTPWGHCMFENPESSERRLPSCTLM